MAEGTRWQDDALSVHLGNALSVAQESGKGLVVMSGRTIACALPRLSHEDHEAVKTLVMDIWRRQQADGR